jgi:hydroxymethylbilane synthase
VRLATRGSALALAQARWVAERLGGDVELVVVTTSGDRRRAVDDKREWVAELEDALLRDEADLAVHSAKDVPVVLADGCALVGAPERADPRDVLCGAPSLDGLPPGARVGT